MTAVVNRRAAWLLLVAFLVLVSLSDCTIWERTADPVHAAAAVVVEPPPPMHCGSVPGGGTPCTSGRLPGSPQARMVAAALLELRVTRSLRGAS